MFGIESLREEIVLLRDSIDELRDKFQVYIENEVTFSEMTERVDEHLTEFKKEFFNDFGDVFKLESINMRLHEIIKRLPELIKEVKVKDKKGK